MTCHCSNKGQCPHCCLPRATTETQDVVQALKSKAKSQVKDAELRPFVGLFNGLVESRKRRTHPASCAEHSTACLARSVASSLSSSEEDDPTRPKAKQQRLSAVNIQVAKSLVPQNHQVSSGQEQEWSSSAMSSITDKTKVPPSSGDASAAQAPGLACASEEIKQTEGKCETDNNFLSESNIKRHNDRHHNAHKQQQRQQQQHLANPEAPIGLLVQGRHRNTPTPVIRLPSTTKSLDDSESESLASASIFYSNDGMSQHTSGPSDYKDDDDDDDNSDSRDTSSSAPSSTVSVPLSAFTVISSSSGAAAMRASCRAAAEKCKQRKQS